MPKKDENWENTATLHYGVLHQKPELVEKALNTLSDGGKKPISDLLNVSRDGVTLMHWNSAQSGETAGVISKMLMEHGADPHKKDHLGKNSVDIARDMGNTHALQAILTHPKYSSPPSMRHSESQVKRRQLKRLGGLIKKKPRVK